MGPFVFAPPPAPLPVEPLPRPSTAQPSFLPLIVLAAGVGGLFLIMGLVALVVLIRSPQEQVSHVESGGPQEPPSEPQGPISPPPTPQGPPKGPVKRPAEPVKPAPPKKDGEAPPSGGERPPPKPIEWVLPRDLKERLRYGDFKGARGLTADARGRVYVTTGDRIWRAQGDRSPTVFLKDCASCNGLALGVKGELLASLGKTGRAVRIDVDSREAHVLAGDSKRFHNPHQLVVDRAGGLYLTDASTFEDADKRVVYYIAPSGTVKRLPIDLPRLRGVALAPDDRTLYVVGAGSPDVMAYPLEAPGSPGAGRSLCRLEARDGSGQGATAVAVDDRGQLFLNSPALPGVQVVSPGGERLASLALPEAPVACALGGEGRRTLFVLTRRSLYSVEIAVPR